MNVLTSDFECTIWNKGSAFDPRNKAVCLGSKWNDEETYCAFDITHHESFLVYPSSLCVFFNAKYDLHWYRRLGFKLPSNIWCCQLAEFILSGQTIRYPSLEDTAVKYGLGHKIDAIKLNYWNKGINTDEIPKEELAEYCKQDVDLTYAIYLRQLELFQENPKLFKLFQLQCLDLLVLEEMEWNGLIYDENLCYKKAKELEEQSNSILLSLQSIYPDIPINFNSTDQLSVFLYGGSIPYETLEHLGFYKNGKPKIQKVVKYHVLPRLVEPVKGSNLKKEGFYATNEATLKKLKGPNAKKFVGPLLKLAELDKLLSTYYKGIPEKNKEHNWKPGELHGQFNQVVAQTGRLSSSDPNLQNFAGECLDLFISRYD